jgi:hypothetical protein
MNVLVEIDFPDGTQYFSKQVIVVGGKQYVNYIAAMSSLNEATDISPDYQVSGVTITFNDVNRHFRRLINSSTNKLIADADVRIKNVAGELLMSLVIQSFSFPPLQFEILCTNKLIEMETPINDKIDATRWPNAASAAINQVIPMAYNSVTRIKAWKVNYGGVGGTRHWLLGSKPIDLISNVEIAGETIPEKDGAAASIWFPTPTTNSIGGVTYYYLRMGHGAIQAKGDYAWVDITQSTSLKKPVAIIIDALSGHITVDTNAAFSTYLDTAGYSTSTVAHVFQEEQTISEILYEFCTAFECNYYFDNNNKVQFSYFDASAVSAASDFQSGNIITLQPGTEYDKFEIENVIRYNYDKNFQNGGFDSFSIYTGLFTTEYGEYKTETFNVYVTDSTQATDAATRRHELRRHPLGSMVGRLPISFYNQFNLGQFVRFAHIDAKTKYPVFYRVIGKSIATDENYVELTLIDYDYLSPSLPLLTESGEKILTENNFALLQ